MSHTAQELSRRLATDRSEAARKAYAEIGLQHGLDAPFGASKYEGKPQVTTNNFRDQASGPERWTEPVEQQELPIAHHYPDGDQGHITTYPFKAEKYVLYGNAADDVRERLVQHKVQELALIPGEWEPDASSGLSVFPLYRNPLPGVFLLYGLTKGTKRIAVPPARTLHSYHACCKCFPRDFPSSTPPLAAAAATTSKGQQASPSKATAATQTRPPSPRPVAREGNSGTSRGHRETWDHRSRRERPGTRSPRRSRPRSSHRSPSPIRHRQHRPSPIRFDEKRPRLLSPPNRPNRRRSPGRQPLPTRDTDRPTSRYPTSHPPWPQLRRITFNGSSLSDKPLADSILDEALVERIVNDPRLNETLARRANRFMRRDQRSRNRDHSHTVRCEAEDQGEEKKEELQKSPPSPMTIEVDPHDLRLQ